MDEIKVTRRVLYCTPEYLAELKKIVDESGGPTDFEREYRDAFRYPLSAPQPKEGPNTSRPQQPAG